MNHKTHESESDIFWLGHFPKTKIESENSFSINYYIVTIGLIMFEKIENLIFNQKLKFSVRGGQGFFVKKVRFFFGCMV